jgi:hypothetical protein
LSALPTPPSFVLATAFSEHALEAFDLGVVDYLLKPFSEERVEQCLRRLIGQRVPSGPGALRVVARRKRSLVFLDPADIWAFEASDRLSFVHSRLGRFDIDLSLAAIEASFGRSLLRVHRNWLVNLAFVKELEREEGETTVFVGASSPTKPPASGSPCPATAPSPCGPPCSRTRPACAAPDDLRYWRDGGAARLPPEFGCARSATVKGYCRAAASRAVACSRKRATLRILIDS